MYKKLKTYKNKKFGALGIDVVSIAFLALIGVQYGIMGVSALIGWLKAHSKSDADAALSYWFKNGELLSTTGEKQLESGKWTIINKNNWIQGDTFPFFTYDIIHFPEQNQVLMVVDTQSKTGQIGIRDLVEEVKYPDVDTLKYTDMLALNGAIIYRNFSEAAKLGTPAQMEFVIEKFLGKKPDAQKTSNTLLYVLGFSVIGLILLNKGE